jgi:hypothetical protein
MPNYVNKALARFQRTPPQKQQDQPYPHVKPTYGAKKQYSQVEDDSPTFNKAGKKFIQEVCRVFLYLAHAVEGVLLPALSSLAFQQANPTEKTMELCKKNLGLHGNAGGCNTNLPHKQHGLSNPQQHIIFIQTKILQSHRKTHLHCQNG